MDLPGLENARPAYLTTFTIKAAGTALGADYNVVSLEIKREVNRVPKATMTLIDGDAAAQTFAMSEEDTLIPGVEVEILGGYASEETTLFKGIITRQRVEVRPHGGSRLIVNLQDPVFRMTQGRHSRNFTDVTDTDVIEQLVALYPDLSAEVTAASLVHAQLVQHQASDWDFLVMRAEMQDMVVICIDGTVRVLPPAAAGSAVIAAVFGEGLFSAELELDAGAQLAAVETGAWDPASQALATAEVDDAATPGPGDLPGSVLAETTGARTACRHQGARDQAVLDQWAGADMARLRRSSVRGKLSVQGTELLEPGVLIELGGFGSRFNGLGFVSAVCHRLGRGDWVTEASIGSDPRSHAERFIVAAPPAGGMLPPVRGLHVGVVAALEGDQAGEDRLQVQLSTITETDGLVWARQALLDAGNGRGTAFRPEIGDEVVIGFLDDDPRDPVILGALHSSAKPSPVPAADDNHEKAIVSRSGMRIHWDDDTVATTIDTPGGNRIVLSEGEGSIVIEDQNSNRIALTSDGMTLDSPGDIMLAAGGDVVIEGINIQLGAKASVKAEGSAGAELKSSGTTAVKGSLVTIN